MEMENKRPGLLFKRTALRTLNKHEVILVAGASDDGNGSEDGGGDDPGGTGNEPTNQACAPSPTNTCSMACESVTCVSCVCVATLSACVQTIMACISPTPAPSPHPKGA